MPGTDDDPGKRPRFEQFLGCIAIAVAACWLVVAFGIPPVMQRIGITFWCPLDDLGSVIPASVACLAASGIGVFVVWFYGFARKPVSLVTVLCSLALLAVVTALILSLFSDTLGTDRHWFHYLAAIYGYGIVQVACSWGLALLVRRLLGRWLPTRPARGGQGPTLTCNGRDPSD